MLLPEGKIRLIHKSILLTKDNFYIGTDETDDLKSINADRVLNVWIKNSTLRYGLSSTWDMRVIIPYVEKKFSFVHSDGVRRTSENEGLGDTRVWFRNQITHQKKEGFFSAWGIGVKLPTGSTDHNLY